MEYHHMVRYGGGAIISVVLFSLSLTAVASETLGSITTGSQYARVCHDVSCSSYGTVNWKPTLNSSTPGAVPVEITDTSITGYVWGDELGWINLAPSGGGITINPATGQLSGIAFSQSGSWINMSPTGYGVTLVDNGSGSDFLGWAWVSGAYGGWMKFDCSGGTGMCVKTDWRSTSYRSRVVEASPKSDTSSSLPTGGRITMSNEASSSSPSGSSTSTSENTSSADIPESNGNPFTPIINVITSIFDDNPTNSTVSKDNNQNSFDTNNDGMPDREPINSEIIVQDDSCFWCSTSVHRELGNIDQIIIKYGFVPKKYEVPLPIPGSSQGVPLNVDLTSLSLTLFALVIIRKLVGLTSK